MKTQLLICLALVLTPYLLSAQSNPNALEGAEETITVFKENNAKFQHYIDDSYGFVVYPSIGKGGAGLGAAFGTGTVYELGNPIGNAKMTQISLGLQFGGQSYSQLVFFETEADFIRFKQHRIELSAQASAVAIDKGASAETAYYKGVAIFTKTKGGLMYEASFAGQKLKFKPYKSNRSNANAKM